MTEPPPKVLVHGWWEVSLIRTVTKVLSMIPSRRRNLLILFGYLVCMIPLLWVVAEAVPSYAEEGQESETPLDLRAFLSETRGAWTIDAAEISYDPERKIYAAKGSGKITSGDRVL